MHEAAWLFSGFLSGLFIFYFFRKKNGNEANAIELLQRQLAQLSLQLNDRMKETSSTLHSTQTAVGQRLDHNASLMALLERKLGAMEESSKRIFSMGEGLQDLKDILKSPKLRGSLGEFFLEDLLRQILPKENLLFQHSFRSGEMVDAALRAGENLLCIDSKFPMESFLRLTKISSSDPELRKKERKNFDAAIKRHADGIARKYILPHEGTFDFAMMYIPAENIFYETILREEEDSSLHSYLLERRVIPVSPNSLYAYLQVVLLGLRGLQVEANARKISRNLDRFRVELNRLKEDFLLLGKHMRNALGAYEESAKRVEKLDDRLSLDFSLEEPENSTPPQSKERPSSHA